MATCITLENGKYTVRHDNGANLRAERYGEPWRDLCGDSLVLALVQRVEDLELALQKIGTNPYGTVGTPADPVALARAALRG